MKVPLTHNKKDLKFMLKAYQIGMENPDKYRNKAVGAVLVKDSEVIAKGFRITEHNVEGYEYKTTHAEHMAILKAGSEVKGATIYTTLEPCVKRTSHPKWHPFEPCCKIIADAEIKRVVIGIMDNEIGAGGAQYLLEQGIRVERCAETDEQMFREMLRNDILRGRAKKQYDEFLRSTRQKTFK